MIIRENRVVNRKKKMCMIFTHKDFDEYVYSVERCVTVTKEVPDTYLFGGKYSSFTRREAI